MKKTETKWTDYYSENIQLYHNVGNSVGNIVALNPYGIISDPWKQIAVGAARYLRVGDKITPVGMKLNLWLANKNDRPNMIYRIIIGYYASKINPDTGARWNPINNEKIMTVAGGNNLNNMLDPERFRAIKDKIVRIENGVAENAAGAGKETHKKLSFWISRRKRSTIIFDANGSIVNSPLAVFVVPYDSYGTLVTDNIASCAYNYRLYWKDL